MAKSTKEESHSDKATDINFIDALNDLVDNIPLRKGTKKYSLLLLIRSYYKSNDDAHLITSIPIDDLIKNINFAGEKAKSITSKQVSEKRKNLSSLKSSLNKNLRSMAEEGRNPLGIIVGKSNAFNVSQKVEPKHDTELTAQDLTSELQEVLSNEGVELKGEIAEKFNDILRKELSAQRKGIEEIEKKRGIENANKQLKKKLKELRKETSSIKQELTHIKEDISVEESGAGVAPGQQLMKEIEKKITSTLQTDIEKDMKALSEKDRELEDKERALSEKENKILQLQQELSDKDLNFRKELSKEKDLLEKHLEKEKQSIQKTVDSLAVEQKNLIEEKERTLDESLKAQDDYEQKLEQLHKEKSEEEIAGLKNWKNLTGNMASLMRDEKEFQK
ncbi:MAG: hypothetical protein QGG87_00750, partial [Nitrospinota bacterium]|nr:hypothetical protein [Nitrospinota bacterium]